MDFGSDPLQLLRDFSFDRVLNEEPEKCRLTLLGTLTDQKLPSIIRIERTAFSAHCASDFFTSFAHKVRLVESTDIYSWLAGWTTSSEDSQPQGDVKINVICPATDVHIRKYTKQQSILVRETPRLFRTIVEPYITAFPSERTRWVTEILEGHTEQSKILFSSPDYVILPDMKWDLHTIGSLYLLAIVRDTAIRCLRDLRSKHLPLLRSIKHEAYKVVRTKWNIEPYGLRMYIHYQPSYYHFHVHIVNANYQDNGMGMAVGQAHLLEDVISLLELDQELPGPGIFEKMTLTYGLGDQHGLFAAMKVAQAALES